MLGIIGLIAAVAGAAMTQYANYSANKKAQARLNEAMYQLNEDGKKITDVLANDAQNFEHDKRVQTQAEMAKGVSDDIKANVAASQALRDESQAVQGNVSNDYTTARQAAQTATQAQSDAFADLVGKIRSAALLRQNEGIGMMKTGQEVDKLARNARGNWQVGQQYVQDALHSKDGLKAAGQIVGALGSAMSMAGGMGALANTATTTGTTASAGAVGSVAPYGFTGNGATMNAFGMTSV